jgi:hypothetical protein
VDRRTTTDASGFFETLDLADSEYTVRASAPQRTPKQILAAVRDGLAGEVRLALEPERRTVFVVRGPDGASPSSVLITSATGGMLGPLYQVSCADGGRCEVSDFPAGRWTVFVASGRSAAALFVVDLPRDEVPVALRRSGELELRAAAGEAGAAWQVRLSEAATGIVVPVAEWINPGRGEWVPVPASGLSLRLPEGSWRVEAFAPDGETSVREVTVEAGGTTTVQLE